MVPLAVRSGRNSTRAMARTLTATPEPQIKIACRCMVAVAGPECAHPFPSCWSTCSRTRRRGASESDPGAGERRARPDRGRRRRRGGGHPDRLSESRTRTTKRPMTEADERHLRKAGRWLARGVGARADRRPDARVRSRRAGDRQPRVRLQPGRPVLPGPPDRAAGRDRRDTTARFVDGVIQTMLSRRVFNLPCGPGTGARTPERPAGRAARSARARRG